jgi:2-hydroxychromene-2-carboxylate isomerase
MSITVEFHFDFGSPNSYYAHCIIPAIETRTHIKFDYVPILLGGVFKATNNRSPMEALAGIRNKSEYNALETRRFIKKHSIEDFRFNPHFPINTLAIMRGAIYAMNNDIGDDYIEAIYRCMWEKELNMADPAVIQQALVDAGLPAEAIIAGSADMEVKQQLIHNTAASVERGAFGSPTFFVGEEIFFGKDKLGDVEDEILASS